MKTPRDFLAHDEALARLEMAKYLEEVAKMMEDSAKRLKARAEEVVNDPDSSISTTPAERFAWAVNEIENLMRNLSFGNRATQLAARHAAAYALLKAASTD